MKKEIIKKILKEEFFLVPLIFLLLLVSLSPLLYDFFLPAPGKIKLYWHNYAYDFTYYRSVMLQGLEGRFLTEDRYTTEPHQPIFIRPFYIFLGHFSRLFNTDPTLSYHLSRIVLGAVFLLIIVWFIQTYFTLIPPSEESLHISSTSLEGRGKDKRLVAYLLAFFVGGFPKGNWPYLPFLTELIITRRITFLPHFLFGYIGLTLLILCLLNSSRFSLKFFLAAIFLGFAGLSHPSSLIFFFPLTIVFLFLLFLSGQPLKTKISLLKSSAISFLLLYPFLSYLFFVLTKPPWNILNRYQVSLGGSFFEYLLALGPNAFLAIGGVVLTLVLLLRRKEVSPLRLMVTSWFTTSNFLVLFPRFKSFYAETRFTQVALFLPMALLATDFVFFISRQKKIFVLPVVLSLIFITLPAQIAIYKAQFDEVKTYCQQQLTSLAYPPVVDYPPIKLMEAIYWLRDKTHKKDIVLSQFYAGNLIPAYSGNFVYLGHNSETINFGEKSQMINQFFSANPEKQINFLIANNIRYIFYGPQEKSLGKLMVEKLPIVPIFQNELVTIYYFTSEESPSGPPSEVLERNDI